MVFSVGINPYGCKNCFKEFERRDLLEQHHTLCKFRETIVSFQSLLATQNLILKNIHRLQLIVRVHCIVSHQSLPYWYVSHISSGCVHANVADPY